MRLFLVAHGGGDAFHAVVEPCFLHHALAVFKNVLLPGDLEFNRALHMAEGIEVLQFGAGAEGACAARTDRHVGVATKTPFLHVPVADPEVHHNCMERLEIGDGLLRAPHVRLGHDFDERHAGPVEIDETPVLHGGVDVLARVRLHVNAGDADAPRLSSDINVKVAVFAQGAFKLGNLVVYRHVRVKIVFPGKNGVVVDGAAKGETGPGGILHRALVEHRQRAGHTGAHFAHVGVRLHAKGGRAGTEQLGFRTQMNMHFKADDGFVLGHAPSARPHRAPAGATRAARTTGG